MLTDSLAPIKRAGLFFGFMGLAVATLTFGADLQTQRDQSSESIAQAKIERHEPTDSRFAAVDPSQRSAGSIKRAIPNSQQARLEGGTDIIIR